MPVGLVKAAPGATVHAADRTAGPVDSDSRMEIGVGVDETDGMLQ